MPGDGAKHRSSARSGLTAPWLLTGLIAALVGAVAVSGASGAAGASRAALATTASGSTARTGCNGNASSGSTSLSLSVAGHSRVVIVHLPTGYNAKSKVALVLNMHGSGATAADQELFTEMDLTADARGFIVAYPQALIPEGAGFDWNVPNEPLVTGAPVPRGPRATLHS